MTLFKRLFKDQKGATAIEYGLIAALITVAIIAGLGAFSKPEQPKDPPPIEQTLGD